MTKYDNQTLFYCRIGVCVILLQLTVYPHAEELTPQQLIDRMGHAARALNYDGIFVYRHGRQLDTLRIIHKNGPEGETERLVSMTGHPREIIRNNKSVTCIFPDQKLVMVENSFPRRVSPIQSSEPGGKLSALYRFSLSGQGRVAGYEAYIVSVQPNDNYRYGYRLWIDKVNYLLLKSELKNESGYPLEQVEFTQLTILDSVPDAALQPAVSSAGFTRYDNARAARAVTQRSGYWDVTWSPDGFAMMRREKQALAASDDEVDHLVYSDGMALVSIFIETSGNNTGFIQGPTRIGAVNAFAHRVNGYRVTAVGEVPPTTVERMARSVYPAP
jgi:sigma-E factor negative regulatory protein RseB